MRNHLFLWGLLALAGGIVPAHAAPPPQCADFYERLDEAVIAPFDLRLAGNAEIRAWYNRQVEKQRIETLNARWQKEGVSLEERAHRIWNMRHRARMLARDLMPDPEAVARIRRRDLELYGSEHGPSFEWSVSRGRSQGLSEAEVYQGIIEGASRTSAEYNSRFGITREPGL